MIAPELTPEIFCAVADWLARGEGRTVVADLVQHPGMLADVLYSEAQELREQQKEDERLGALVYAVSQPAHHFANASDSVREECIRIGRIVRDDTIGRQKTAARGEDPWPPYKQPTMGELRALGEKLISHYANSIDGVTGTGSFAVSSVNRLYELRLRPEPLTDEPLF